MHSSFRTLPLLACLAMLLACPPAGTAQTNGIFADFETSLGNFTCVLDFTNAPMTAANFIGLAEGERNWLNRDNGKVERRPFYDGLTFHRVVTNFVIQTGSPGAAPDGGPGYAFPDEFSTNALHDAAGVLSMANSGLNSNGSQFFVTLVPTPGLDFVHSVFGRVTAGMNVVRDIEAVPVGASNKPLTDVIINHVQIRRVGAAALAFNIHTNLLPEVQPAAAEFVAGGTGLEIQFARERDHEYWQYTSTDLSTWTSQRIGLYVDDPPPGNTPINPAAQSSPELGLLVPDIQYTGPLFTPPTATNRDFLLQLTADFLLVINIDPTGAGVYRRTSLDGTPLFTGSFTSSLWSQQAYRGTLWIPDPSSPIMKLDFAYDDAGSGYYRGSYFSTTYAGPFLTDTP